MKILEVVAVRKKFLKLEPFNKFQQCLKQVSLYLYLGGLTSMSAATIPARNILGIIHRNTSSTRPGSRLLDTNFSRPRNASPPWRTDGWNEKKREWQS